MRYEKIENFKRKIIDEYKMNQEKIDEIDKKIKVYEINGLDNRLMIFLGTAMFNYFTGTLLITIFSTSIINLLRNGIITSEMLSFLNFMFPVISGSIGLKCYEKKYDLKNRLNKITMTKSRSGKLYEQLRYELEREKLIGRNRVLGQCY